MTIIEFQFAIGDLVLIHKLSNNGKVKGLYVSKRGELEYQVEWLRTDGGLSSDWFIDDELQSLTK